MQIVAVGWLLVQLTDSKLVIALAFVVPNIPQAVFLLPSGAIADRISRRHIVMVCIAAQAVAGIALGVFVSFGAASVGLLLFSVFCISALDSFSSPSWHASLPDLVPAKDLEAVVTLNGLSFQIARAIGPAIGGFIISRYGTAPVFFTYALFALPLLYAATKLPVFQRGAGTAELRNSLLKDILDGMRVAARDLRLRTRLTLLLILATASSSFFTLLPILSNETWGSGAILYGLLLAAYGCGAAVGTTVVIKFRHKDSDFKILFICCLLTSFTIILISTTVNHPVLLVLSFLVGATWTSAASIVNSDVQHLAPKEFRARIMAIYLFILFTTNAVGGMVWGAMADLSSAGSAMCVAGVVLCIGGPLILSVLKRE